MSTAVIFDMDGTLFDTEAVFQKYWNAIAKERGIVLPDAFKYEICGTSGEVMNRIIEKHYRVKDGTEIQRECKQRVSEELARGVPLKPGCREILASLHARGIPHGDREQRTAGADREQSVCQRVCVLFLCHCERR